MTRLQERDATDGPDGADQRPDDHQDEDRHVLQPDPAIVTPSRLLLGVRLERAGERGAELVCVVGEVEDRRLIE
jgi:hypothetical protein